MTIARGYIATSFVAFALFVAVGVFVSHAPPGSLDRSEFSAYGTAVPLARFLTSAGRFPTYFVLCVVASIFGIARRSWLRRVLLAVFGLVVVWQTSDLCKFAFHRPRPLQPILAESSFGYPSGHADLAIFFYGLWAYYAWQSRLPLLQRACVVAALATWVVAIGWSRLSLGAHFPSDVLGGYLYGGAWLALSCSLLEGRRDRHAT